MPFVISFVAISLLTLSCFFCYYARSPMLRCSYHRVFHGHNGLFDDDDDDDNNDDR